MKTLLSSALLMTLSASVGLAQGPNLSELPIPAQAPLSNRPVTTAPPAKSLPQTFPASSDLDVVPPPVPGVQVVAGKVVVPPATSPQNQQAVPQSSVRGDEQPVIQNRPVLHASPWGVPFHVDGVNPAGAEGMFVGPSTAGGLHVRYPYYSYRRPWYTRGSASLNVDIIW